MCAYTVLYVNLFFMKLTMLNVCLSSIELRTWIVTILTNFMYPKNLWLRMVKRLCAKDLLLDLGHSFIAKLF
jgi:hypothetical protein